MEDPLNDSKENVFNYYFHYYGLLCSIYDYKTDYQMTRLFNKLAEWDVRIDKLPEQIRNQIKELQQINNQEDWDF